jgi:hypothetical protein
MEVHIAGFSHLINHKADATLEVNEDESPKEVFLKFSRWRDEQLSELQTNPATISSLQPTYICGLF